MAKNFPHPRPSDYPVKVKRGLAGHGLFAVTDIPRRQFIIEYTGQLLPDDEAQAIGGRYLYELGNGKTIVGSPRSNRARYANHGCDPNCETKIIGDRVFIYSLRKIRAGEEITYDYGEEYFDYYIKPYGCRCRACTA
jgi:SET domain-containing protein